MAYQSRTGTPHPSANDGTDFGCYDRGQYTHHPHLHNQQYGLHQFEPDWHIESYVNNGTHFNVTQQPAITTVVSGTAVTFQVTFDPQSYGTFIDTVIIENNDSNESTYTFQISGDGTALTDDFVITVQTDNAGTSSDTQFMIPTAGSGYNYNVDCDNDGSDETKGETVTTSAIISAGTYTVRIKDNTGAGTGFPRIYFNNGGDKEKILTIEQWGTGQWTSMESAFYGCSNLEGRRQMRLDLSNVTDMSHMFSLPAPSTRISGVGMYRPYKCIFMFVGVKLSTQNYDALLIGWDAQTLQNGVTLGGGSSNYCRGAAARAHMISSNGWTIYDGGMLALFISPDTPIALAKSIE